MPTIRISQDDYIELKLLMEKEVISKTPNFKTIKQYKKYIMDMATNKVIFSYGDMVHKLIKHYKTVTP